METFFDDRKAKPHVGYNLRRVREIIGMKQDVMGMMSKSQFKQQTVSKWENAETIPDNVLEEFAEVMGVSPEFIKNFNEEKAIYNIQNNRDHSSHNANYVGVANYEPVEKVVEVFEKFIANDKERSDLIVNLNKAVLSLAEEVRKLKAEK